MASQGFSGSKIVKIVFSQGFLESDSLFIRNPQRLLDMEKSKSQPYGLSWGANIGAELRRIILLQLLPRYELRKQHPADRAVIFFEASNTC